MIYISTRTQMLLAMQTQSHASLHFYTFTSTAAMMEQQFEDKLAADILIAIATCSV